MIQRTQIYVDTSYLLASFYNTWEIGARSQLEIDLPEVVALLNQIATEHLKQPVQRQLWYDGVPDAGPHRYQRSLRNEAGVQLRTGQLIEWGDRRTQKAVDTRLVADMVVHGLKGQFSDFILVSGDADMLPGVEEAVAAGVRVHLYGFGQDSMSNALRFACDTTTVLDPREDFKDTMRIQPIETPVIPTGDNSATTETDTTSTGTGTGDNTSTDTATESATASNTDSNTITPASLATAHPTPTTEVNNAAAETASNPTNKTTETTPEPTIEKPLGETGAAIETGPSPIPTPATFKPRTTTQTEQPTNTPTQPTETTEPESAEPETAQPTPTPQPTETTTRPNPGMMARHRKLRSHYVPLPSDVWAATSNQTAFDIGQQYAVWWWNNCATEEQLEDAHLLTGGGLPPNIDRPLLQFACETLHEYTLTESQRVDLRDGFHSGIRSILLKR